MRRIRYGLKCRDLINSFYLRPLGSLQYLRVWHNNSGRGNYASWYCTAIIVRDLQTNEQFEFMCNKWFACEKDDGEIERLVQVRILKMFNS